MMSKRKSTSSAAATSGGGSGSSRSSKKSRSKADLRSAEAEVTSSVVKEEEMKNAEAASFTADDSGSDSEGPAARLVGDPVPDEEARRRWPKRYEEKVTFFADA